MGAPITWRNVDVNPIGEISRAMMSSQTGINAGFDNFQKILDRQQATDTANWNQEKTNKTNAYLNEVGSFKTPEEYQAALDSGRLHQMLTDGGAQIDQAAARQAMGAQMGILQKRLTEGQQFQDNQTKYAQKGERDSIGSLIAQGLIPQAKTRLGEVNLDDETALYQALATKEAQAAEADWKKKEHAQSEAKFNVWEKTQKETDLVNQGTNQIHQAFLASEEARMAGLRSLSQEFRIPLGTDNTPDLSGLTPTQTTEFKQEMQRRGLDIGTSTTKAKNTLRELLIKQGVSPAGIATADSNADTLFRGKTALSAEDQEGVDSKIANIDERVKKAGKENIFYSSPEEEVKQKVAVLDKVGAVIKDGPMTQNKIKTQISEWMDTGIEVTGPDGKPQLIKVPPKVIEQAFAASSESDTWVFNNTNEGMLNVIKTLMVDPQYKDLRAEADFLRAGGDIRERNAIKEAGRNKAGIVTPADLAARFDTAIKKKLEGAADKK